MVENLPDYYRKNIWLSEQLTVLESVTPIYYEHSLRVARIAYELAKHKGLDSKTVDNITKAGLLHDIGKATVPKDILEKESELTETELAEMDKHVRVGYELIAKNDPQIAQIVVGHHEFQKRRHPRLLDRENENREIKELQQLLALADHTDSLLSVRSYKQAWTKEKVFESLISIIDDEDLVNFSIEIRILMGI